MDWIVEVVERSPRRGWIMTEDQRLVWVTLPKTFEPLPRRSRRGAHDRLDRPLAPHEQGL